MFAKPRGRRSSGILVAAAAATWIVVPGSVLAQQEPELRVEQIEARATEIARLGLWGNEVGTWRTKTQLVFDTSTRRLVRKMFKVWDPAPSQNLDFTWTPAGAPSSDAAIISGAGQLVWRTRDRPSYDPRSIVSTYRGGTENGRPSGRGSHRDTTGVFYDGEWVDGKPQGQGHLKFPNGDDYRGAFLAGKPSGHGRYIDATGEIYEGPFVEGRREGRATTTLPSGAVYQSEWRGGIEAPNSRQVRLAQQGKGGAQGAASSDDVRVGVIVNPVNPKSFKSRDIDTEEFARQTLGYVGTNTEKGLDIRPDNKRLMGMWKGDTEIQLTRKEEHPAFQVLPELSYGVFSYGKTLLPPLGMTLEVQNRATVPIQITGAYLDVAKSTTDRQPAVQISIGNDNFCGAVRYHEAYSPKLGFENFGWGKAQNARLSYDFVAPDSKATPTSFRLSKSIGDIDKILTVSFEPDLAAAGVDVRLLARTGKTKGFKCNPESIQACLKDIGEKVFGSLTDKIAFSGKLPGDDSPDPPKDGANKDDATDDDAGDMAALEMDLITAVAGKLEYDWTDAAGGVHRRTSPFRANLWLGKLDAGPECGDGASIARLRPNPLELKVDQARYRIAVPFRQAVPGGRVARYSLELIAGRASEHDFTVVLQLADGREIRSRPVNLQYFIPSWYPRRQGS